MLQIARDQARKGADLDDLNRTAYEAAQNALARVANGNNPDADKWVMAAYVEILNEIESATKESA